MGSAPQANVVLSQIPRINSIDRKCNGLADALMKLADRFCLYHHDKRLVLLGVITKRHDEGLVDMVIFNGAWSGGSDTLLDVPPRIIDSLIPEDEQNLDGTWEPLIDVEEVVQESRTAHEKALAQIAKLEAELAAAKAEAKAPEPENKGEDADDETDPESPAAP